jgi:hypothetical protein
MRSALALRTEKDPHNQGVCQCLLENYGKNRGFSVTGVSR